MTVHEHTWTPWKPFFTLGLALPGETIEATVHGRLCTSSICGTFQLRNVDGSVTERDIWEEQFQSEDGLCAYCRKPCKSLACFSCRIIQFGDEPSRDLM